MEDPDAYDQWDAITQTLWEQTVIDAINYGINEGREKIEVPKYGMTYPDYSEFSFVEVRRGREAISNLALVELANDDPGFTDVRCLQLDGSGRRTTAESHRWTQADLFSAIANRTDRSLM